MAGPFQDFVAEPRLPFDNQRGASAVGSGLAAAGAVLEAAAGIKTAVDTNRATSELESIQQQASEGVVDFKTALKQRAEALGEGDKAAFKQAGDRINTLLAGEAQGRLSPMAVQAQIKGVIRQNSRNPRVAAQLNATLSASGLLGDAGASVELDQLSSLEESIREAANENNVDFATAYSFINQQAASARAVDAQKLAAARGQQNFSTYSTGVRGNTSLLLDGGVSEGVEYKPVTMEYVNATTAAGGDLGAIAQITSQFKASLELRRQQALSYAAVQKDNFEKQGQLMDNADYSNTLSEINARFDGIQKVLDSADPIANMKAVNGAVSVGGQNYRDTLFGLLGLPEYVGTDPEFQIKFLSDTLPALAGRVKAALPEEELAAMAGAGDTEASVILSMGAGRVQYMNSLVSQISNLQAIGTHPTPAMMSEVARATRETYSKAMNNGSGDKVKGREMLNKVNSLLMENGSDKFDTATRQFISTDSKAQASYDNLAGNSISQYVDTYDTQFSSLFGSNTEVKVFLRNPQEDAGTMSRLFGSLGKEDYFYAEGFPTAKQSVGLRNAGTTKRRRVLDELNNVVSNLSSYKTPKEMGEWVGQIVEQFRAKGIEVDIEGFNIDVPGLVGEPITGPSEATPSVEITE